MSTVRQMSGCLQRRRHPTLTVQAGAWAILGPTHGPQLYAPHL